MSRCTGACCAAFPLSVSHERLWNRWPWIEDGDLILAMVLPVALGAADAARAAAGAVPIPESGVDEQHYMCVHFDSRAGRCKAYEERPAMCREYPYERTCEHCGATSADVNLLAIAEAAA